MASLISKADVAGLNNHAFRAVLNALVQAEANLSGVPLTNLDLNLKDTVPDQGVDGRIVWSNGVAHEVFRPGTNVMQYKSGKLKAGEIAAEFKKKGVQEALKDGGYYVLFVGQDYVASRRDKHIKSLRKMCTQRKLDPSHCTILFGDQIARWISRFTAVAIMPELGKGYPAFVTVEQWQLQRNLGNPYKPDASREQILNELRSFVASKSDENVLRVEGQAGVGKTRVVLEALRIAGVAQRTIYHPNADDTNAQGLLTLLQSETQATAIMVLDECDRERQETLEAFAALAGGRLRLVCIGVADILYQPPPGLSRLFQLPPLQNDEMRLILADFHPDAPKEIVEIGVRLSGGMPKLAIFIANTLVRKQDLALTDLVKIPDVRTFLRRFVDPNTFKTLKALSLLAKVGWQDDLKGQAEALAKLCSIPFEDVQTSVKRLKEQGVVLDRGKYLYVSPDLLAISAAAELWDERGAALIEVITDLPSQEPRRQLLRRLATMPDFPPVKLAVERLLGEQGLYKSLEDLEHQFLSEIFRLLASALPEAAQKTLDRIIQRATDRELRGFKQGRRDVMWALESLLRWPETSLAAARIVRRLALTENESIGNNATGTFQGYFHAFLSGSPVPLSERLLLVSELIATNDLPSRLLAVKAASAALAFYEWRMGGEVDHVSLRRFPAEWKPKTWEELWEARRTAIQQLSSIAKGDDEASALARQALVQSVLTLIRHGQPQDAVSILNASQPQNDKERREVMEAAQRLLNEPGNALDETQRKTLEQIASRTFGSSYFDRLRRWVGRRLHTDYDLSGGTGFDSADLKAMELAQEGYAQGISDDELGWLTSAEAENVWAFGKRLGELDTEKRFLERIISVTPTDMNCLLLASYLIGLATTLGKDTSEQILDDLAKVNPTLAFIATWRFGPSEKGGQRVVSLMEAGGIDTKFFQALRYGTWVESLPLHLAIRITELILAADPEVIAEPAISILDHLLKRHPELFPNLEGLIWKALEIAPANRMTYLGWQWGELAGQVAPRAPVNLALLVLDRLERDESPHISSDPLIQALMKATEADPGGVWEVVGKALLRTNLFSYRLLLSLDRGYGELIPADTLVRWARENPPRGPLIAAQLVAISAPMTESARKLITEFPENDEILRIFAAGLYSGSFTGPMSANLETLMARVRQWEQDPDQRIKNWAHRLGAALKEQIREQKLIEEGEEL